MANKESRSGNERGEGEAQLAKVLYLSGEAIPSPATIFAYWCLRRLELVEKPLDCIVVPTLTKGEAVISPEYINLPEMDGKEGRAFLSRSVDKVLAIANDLNYSQKESIKKIASYINYTFISKNKSQKEAFEKRNIPDVLYKHLVNAIASSPEDPQNILERVTRIIDNYVEVGLNPFVLDVSRGEVRSEEIGLLLDSKIQTLSAQIKDFQDIQKGKRITVEIPVLQKDKKGRVSIGETRIVRYLEVERALARAKILVGEKVGFAIVGPKNSGKSTLVANLALAVDRFCTQLYEETDIKLKVGTIDFDVSTPDVDLVTREKAKGKERKLRGKVKWSKDKAANVALRYLERNTNINLIDTPGGSPDEITDILLKTVDDVLLIIAEKDDEKWGQESRIWKEALKKNGFSTKILVRSRLEGEKSRTTSKLVETSITSVSWRRLGDEEEYSWIERLGARITSLDRKLINQAVFDDLAALLVLDILPQIVIDKKVSSLNYLKYLREQV